MWGQVVGLLPLQGILGLGGAASLAPQPRQNPGVVLGGSSGVAIFSKMTYGVLAKFEFQITCPIFPSIGLSHAVSPSKVCVVHVKCRFNLACCVLSGSPTPSSQAEGAVRQE